MLTEWQHLHQFYFQIPLHLFDRKGESRITIKLGVLNSLLIFEMLHMYHFILINIALSLL